MTNLTKKNTIFVYYVELAHQHHLRHVSLDPLHHDATLLNFDLHVDYVKLQAIPLNETATTYTIATADPSAENIQKIEVFFKRKTKKNIDYVVASRQNITDVLAHRFKKEYLRAITHGRDDADLFHSASYTFTKIEKFFLIIMLCILAIAALGDFFTTALWVNVFLAAGTVVVMAYKMGLSLHSLRFLRNKKDGIPNIQGKYPIYTILLPLLREKEETISLLLDALNRFDYPTDRLDIKFMLEQDDHQTLAVLKKFNLPWYYHILLVPPGLPRSKPRACNYGLQFAFGKYLTIYDAEDQPDADQLKSALEHFLTGPVKRACIQAPLNFYNYRENIVTRLFTVEYTYWFDFLIPALDALGMPVPLGGTSNHFKTAVLRKLRGWDPFVGTEDAEMGVRLYRHGYRVGTVRSTTYEEANTKWINWFFQRTRWNKGYMQTYLINMRDPLHMIKQVGLWRYLHFQLFVGGNVFIQLANLPLWIFCLTTLFCYNSHVVSLYPKLLLYMTWFNFLVGNMILLITQFIATYRRKLYCLLAFIPLKIVYWMVMSLAGYYAIIELLSRPGYWYKTEHGISNQGRNTDVPISKSRKK